MEYLLVGTLVKTIGLKGEVKVYPITHFRDSRFKKGNHLFLSKDGEIVKEVTIKSRRVNGNCDNLFFNEITSIEEAEKYIHYDLLTEKDTKILKKDMYYFSDLIGLNVYFTNGDFIGQVSKVEEYTSYQTLRVKHGNDKDVLIPFVKAFIKDVNLEEKKIIINFIEGLVWK